MAKKSGYHHGDLRRALLAEAVEVLSEGGARSLSMRGLARRLGVSHAAPAHHFGTKAALLAAIAADSFDQLAAQMEAAQAEVADPVARFSATGAAYIRYACANPARFRVMFQPELTAGDNPELREQQRRAFRVLMENARASAPAELELDVDAVALAAWTMVHGVATLWLDGPLRQVGERRRFDSVEEVAERVLGMLQRLLRGALQAARQGEG